MSSFGQTLKIKVSVDGAVCHEEAGFMALFVLRCSARSDYMKRTQSDKAPARSSVQVPNVRAGLLNQRVRWVHEADEGPPMMSLQLNI